ncbi:hypothetical protein ELS43_09530 [Shigella flexneri]|nr:hypothetical protein [Shigella flexneri]
MNPHDRLRIVLAEARQEWRDFAYVMQAHENRYIKRAGVAGIRARAYYFDSTRVIIWMTIYLGECACHWTISKNSCQTLFHLQNLR